MHQAEVYNYKVHAQVKWNHIHLWLLLIRYQQCQLQQGSMDCGLFAFAFAGILACGNHLNGYNIRQDVMRQHLCIVCLPVLLNNFQLKGKHEKTKLVWLEKVLPVYCNCHMPVI